MDKLGLILEGGGIKGAYQVGAMKALDEIGVRYDGVAGTSIGAINGALYLDGGIDKMLDVWNNVKANTVYDLTDEEIDALHGLRVPPAVLKVVLEKRLKTIDFLDASYKRAQTFFQSIVNEDAIRRSGKDFGLVAFEISEMKPCEKMSSEIEMGKLIDYIIASGTFPIFPAKVIDGKKYIDGGVYDNMPINLLARVGYEKMLVIRTNVASKPPRRKIENENLKLFYIAPKEDLGAAMAFSATRAHNFMECGYNDTLELLDNGLKDFLFGKDNQ